MAVEFGVLLPTRGAIMSGRPETAPLTVVPPAPGGSAWAPSSLKYSHAPFSERGEDHGQ